MELLTLASTLGVYGLMILIVAAAICVVTLRSIFHAALCLAVVLLGISGIYISLHAEFLAMVQVLIYVGAVMTLLVFVIMLTEKVGSQPARQNNRQSPLALLGIIAFLFMIIRIILQTPWAVKAQAPAAVSTFDLGQALLGTYAFPFEVISLVLLAALIGSLVIARKDRQP